MRPRHLAACALVAGLFAGGCSKKEEKEAEPVVPVKLADVRQESIDRIIRAQGILRALDQSAVTPKISAPVAKFYVNRGDHVKKGQLIATLENRDLAAAVTDAEGSYQQASAQYRNTASGTIPNEMVKAQSDVQAAREAMTSAKKVLDSREQLYKEGALARRLVDEAAVSYAQARSAFETAQKQLQTIESVGREEEAKAAAGQMESAKGKVEAARAQLGYSEVRSPITGVVADRPVFAGEMANTGSPLATIVDISSVIARVNIPQASAAYVKVGQPATIAGTDSAGEVQGKVTVVSPAVDPQSTTVEIWVQALNPGERLRPGGTVHVEINAGRIPSAVVVPASAILPGAEGGAQLLIVGSDMVAHARPVNVGIRNDEVAQILDGAKTGDRVVVEGGVGVEDGAKVTLAKEGDGEKKSDEKSGKESPAKDE